MRDLVSNIGVVLALAPAVQAAAADGLAIPLKGFDSLAFAINTGAIVEDGDFGVKVQESEDGLAFTDADASAVLGSVPATLAEASSYKLGYIGFKPFARLAVTKAGGTSIALGAVAIKGHARERPVS
ncbi:hypothetical protein NVS89_04440 [Ancylobacter sp. MQZ15Z-1]|uniref:Uncharacterized protein n=1 Tax=Ancylobacter mangrovi TaxID=2972472 RepID=A0A9X2PAG7_9HYPH|nr:hypothetical protein [Ancylobacter mangrovi]MCS0494335.1 hypothetical protein [Ancylobacter mangrovi]